ncbi:peptide deformylase [Pseudonocardia sp. CA-107938]|uniref:peptide deformylase n=1 Tax=Pseudonocardia sp. CA-107938 TaxID=3240021 RepID=UPI003D8B2B64
MTVRPLRYLGDPVLRTPTDPVTEFDGRLARLVDDLMDSVRLPGRAGLAAPQIGVGLAVFSYDVDGHLGYVVNPEITHTEGTYRGGEACLSLPGAHADVERAAYAVVVGCDRTGKPITVEGTGEFARCLQHETDHLAGRLYVDLLEPAERRKVMRAVAVP